MEEFAEPLRFKRKRNDDASTSTPKKQSTPGRKPGGSQDESRRQSKRMNEPGTPLAVNMAAVNSLTMGDCSEILKHIFDHEVSHGENSIAQI